MAHLSDPKATSRGKAAFVTRQIAAVAGTALYAVDGQQQVPGVLQASAREGEP